MAEHARADRSPEPPQGAPTVLPMKPVKPIEERYFQTREMRQNEWHALVGASVTPEDLLKREFWGQVRQKLAPGDKVVVFSENRRMYAEMVVFSVGLNYAELRFIAGPILVAAEVASRSIASDFEIRDLGEIKKWGIIRITDGREIKADGSLKTAEDAQRWLGEYLKLEARKVA